MIHEFKNNIYHISEDNYREVLKDIEDDMIDLIAQKKMIYEKLIEK
jgi:hypothetical protein